MTTERRENGGEFEYPESFSVKPVVLQVDVLQSLPHCADLRAGNTFDHLIERQRAALAQNRAPGADGFFAIPKPSIFGSYHEAVARMVELLGIARPGFVNACLLSKRRLQLTDRTQRALARLERKTPGDFLVFPAQLGRRHQWLDVQETRRRMAVHEFGLGPYEVGMILVTHPERFTKERQLSIDCAGCEYWTFGAEEKLPKTLRFRFTTYLSLVSRHSTSTHSGPATGFLLI